MGFLCNHINLKRRSYSAGVASFDRPRPGPPMAHLLAPRSPGRGQGKAMMGAPFNPPMHGNARLQQRCAGSWRSVRGSPPGKRFGAFFVVGVNRPYRPQFNFHGGQ